MLKLKLQYFDSLMRADSLGKTLTLGKIEGRRRTGWQRMWWLIALLTQWTGVAKDREAWPSQETDTDLPLSVWVSPVEACVSSGPFPKRLIPGCHNLPGLLQSVSLTQVRPLWPQACTRDSQASLAASLAEWLFLSPGSWGAQGFVCALQESVSPVLWKFYNQILLAFKVKFPCGFSVPFPDPQVVKSLL